MKKILTTLLLFHLIIISSQNQLRIKFYNDNQNGLINIYADNNELFPISALFEFSLENMQSNIKNNEVVIIPSEVKRYLIATIVRIDPKKASKFQYKNKFDIGDASKKNYDENYIYDLPFEKNKTFLVFQGYNGNFSHQNKFALDFNFKIGEKIYSAREGKVVDVVENNVNNCPTIECAKYNNKIIVMHKDGTFAEYLHLKYNGVEVNKGDEIKKGQLIGYSGNTGFSNGPHLHFSVFINKDGEKLTLKSKFRTSNNDAEFLEEKKTYTKNY